MIGPPGAGKTTIGRHLAGRLKVAFVDTDEAVEAQAGQPVSEIFVRQGEPAFRSMEREAVAAALAQADQAPMVIALGGGAPLDPATARALEGATVVFLDVSDALAIRRVGLSAARPLLAGSPRKAWRELMAQRRPVYEGLADVIIQVDGLSPQDAAGRIAALVMEGER
ncbi:MAG: shikimate kinase [Bifidobacteriaceae bacterium]|nr:shikimate kinase [Bifidobacteriaceae bacterium]